MLIIAVAYSAIWKAESDTIYSTTAVPSFTNPNSLENSYLKVDEQLEVGQTLELDIHVQSMYKMYKMYKHARSSIAAMDQRLTPLDPVDWNPLLVLAASCS